jgi:CubicO group peptidase (beta-lactamase class C family)
MSHLALLIPITFLVAMPMPSLSAEIPQFPQVEKAMDQMVHQQEVAGTVTAVTTKDQLLHLGANGWSDLAGGTPMATDSIFWIASMTKPLTAVAILMLQDEGKLNVTDPVARHIPEFAHLKTPSGKPADLTLTQILAHTSGLGEGDSEEVRKARTLADLIPAFLAAPMQAEPGVRWRYCQSGINTAARIVEIVSGQSFDQFLQERLLTPLGMHDTSFYLSAEQASRLAGAYARNEETGQLEPGRPYFDPTSRNRPPFGHAGLFSTAADYDRFCQMLLQQGVFEQRRYLSTASVTLMTRSHTGELAAGFVPGSAWGLATSLVEKPQGVTQHLSPGSYGHGGVFGTQAWIDPVQGTAYILMTQRTNSPNSDASPVRIAFQAAAVEGLKQAEPNL